MTQSHLVVERTEKIPITSVKKIVSEPIKGHEEYSIMVRNMKQAFFPIVIYFTVVALTVVERKLLSTVWRANNAVVMG